MDKGRIMCIRCSKDYLEHQCILAEVERQRGLCLNCWDEIKRRG